MDKGRFIKNGYTVEPAEGGSFVVSRGGCRWGPGAPEAAVRGFSNYKDLLAWLEDEHAMAHPAVTVEAGTEVRG